MFKCFISPYNTSPSIKKWDAQKESLYFNLLAEEKSIIGIEHPYDLNHIKYPINWLKENISDSWSILLTSLPSTMQANKINPNFGIASCDENSRQQAVNLIREMNRYVLELNNIFQRQVIYAVNLHTAPSSNLSNIRGSVGQLKKSLSEICSWDWQQANLNIEHCDSYKSVTPQKGYLSLKEEIEAVKQFLKVGIVLNWARSAIEYNSKDAPLMHIKELLDTNLLKGFVFSGCTNDHNSIYGQWKDTHTPPQKIINSDCLVNESLLGEREIIKAMELLQNNKNQFYYGIKVFDPSEDDNVLRKVAINIDTLNAIKHSMLLDK